jgi:hypothetical protein
MPYFRVMTEFCLVGHTFKIEDEGGAWSTFSSGNTEANKGRNVHGACRGQLHGARLISRYPPFDSESHQYGHPHLFVFAPFRRGCIWVSVF